MFEAVGANQVQYQHLVDSAARAAYIKQQELEDATEETEGGDRESIMSGRFTATFPCLCLWLYIHIHYIYTGDEGGDEDKRYAEMNNAGILSRSTTKQ